MACNPTTLDTNKAYKMAKAPIDGYEFKSIDNFFCKMGFAAALSPIVKFCMFSLFYVLSFVAKKMQHLLIATRHGNRQNKIA